MARRKTLRSNRGIAKSRPDVAVIDISLKNESGLELVKNLESQFPLVAIIVLSMHDEALYAERALRAGARGYVMKRETTKNVLSAIRRVLEGGVYVSERVVDGMARKLSLSSKAYSQFAGRALERSRAGNLSASWPGPHHLTNRRGFASEFENGASVLRSREREIRREFSG